MKALYIMAAIMFTGLLMMTVSSYKVFSTVKDASVPAPAGNPGGTAPARPPAPPPAPSPELLPYVTLSYLGLTFFIVGAVGAIIAAFRAMTHRF